jgi:replication factor C subunit 2/4
MAFYISTSLVSLLLIAEAEGLKLGPGALDQLLSISGGDLRKSITLLQSMACSGREIGVKDVEEMSGQVPAEEIDSLVETVNGMNPAKVRY